MINTRFRSTPNLLNLILISMIITITFGTLAPIIFYFLMGRDISIGEPFFIKTLVPFIPSILILVFFKTPGGQHEGRFDGIENRGTFKDIVDRSGIYELLEILGIFLILSFYNIPVFYSILLSLIIKIIYRIFFGLPTDNLRVFGFIFKNYNIGHIGLILFILGIILNDLNKIEIINQISLDKPILKLPTSDLDNNQYFIFRGIGQWLGPNYFSLYSCLIALQDKGIDPNHLSLLTPHLFYPEKRYYYTQNILISKIEIHTNLISDLYCYLGDGNILNGWNLKIIYNPYQILIWLGPLIMIIGIIKELWINNLTKKH